MLSGLFGHPVGIPFFRWVAWNLFLAIIPVALGYLFLKVSQPGVINHPVGRGFLAVLVFLLWLAFVPNTAYLLTEWRHFLDNVVSNDFFRESGVSHPKLHVGAQAVYYLAYSGAGILCFVLAIRPVERAFRFWQIPFPVLALPLFLLISLGVYLGLILRWNSWDLVTRPGVVFQSIEKALMERALLVVIIGFALGLWALYEGLDIWVDGMEERRRTWFAASAGRSGKRKSRRRA